MIPLSRIGPCAGPEHPGPSTCFTLFSVPTTTAQSQSSSLVTLTQLPRVTFLMYEPGSVASSVTVLQWLLLALRLKPELCHTLPEALGDLVHTFSLHGCCQHPCQPAALSPCRPVLPTRASSHARPVCPVTSSGDGAGPLVLVVQCKGLFEAPDGLRPEGSGGAWCILLLTEKTKSIVSAFFFEDKIMFTNVNF